MTEPHPPAEPPAGQTVVIMPTYNERQNLESISGRVRAALPAADLLIVDDNSPDGTGDIADKLAETDSHVQVMHRTEKAGLGKAYMSGFSWALERGYGVIVEMDADGSHAPEDLPRLLDALTDADLALGSRYVPGGRVVNWPKYRELISRGGGLYSRVALGAKIRDITGGFKAFRREVLEKINITSVASQGYCFQIDLTWRTIEAGFEVVEVPITFTERAVGESKMSGSIVREALWRVTKWGVRRRLEQVGVIKR